MNDNETNSARRDAAAILFHAGWRSQTLQICSRRTAERGDGQATCWRADARRLAAGHAASGPCWRCLQVWCEGSTMAEIVEALNLEADEMAEAAAAGEVQP